MFTHQKSPSDFFQKRIREINRDLNEKEGVDTPNPYTIAGPFIRKIINENRNTNLLEDNPVFPNFEIPQPQTTQQESRITTPPLNANRYNINPKQSIHQLKMLA